MTPNQLKVPDSKGKVSNLPLLFVRGQPTSLECMSLEELQKFLRFMLKCEMNLSEEPDLDELTSPYWWPQDLPFSEAILTQRHHRGKLSTQLRGAIRKCYSFYNCSFLIDFCRKMTDYTSGVENLQVVENGNGTRSLIRKQDSKLLVTFRSENQDYDKDVVDTSKKPKFSAKTPLKSTDTRRLAETKAVNSSDPALAKVEEVYLCDHCDQGFSSLRDVMGHERVCGKLPENDERKEVAETPAQCRPAHQFFSYLRLGRPDMKAVSPKKASEARIPRATSYEMFTDIPFSSPLGVYIIRSSGLSLDQQNPSVRGYMSPLECVAAVEARCPGTLKALRSTNAWITFKDKFVVTYKFRRRGGEWCHLYTFTAGERRARLQDIRNGLSFRSFRLWKYAAAKKAAIRLKRLPEHVVKQVVASSNTIKVARLDELLPAAAAQLCLSSCAQQSAPHWLNGCENSSADQHEAELNSCPLFTASEATARLSVASPVEEALSGSSSPALATNPPFSFITLLDSDEEEDPDLSFPCLAPQSGSVPMEESLLGSDHLQAVNHSFSHIQPREIQPPAVTGDKKHVECVDLLSSDED